jgi:hypothetical protein
MIQIVLLLAFVIPAILFFLAQQRLLQIISPENREMFINYSTRHSSSYLRLFGSFFFLTGMVCWIIYWVRLVNTKNKLIGLSAGIAR